MDEVEGTFLLTVIDMYIGASILRFERSCSYALRGRTIFNILKKVWLFTG